MEEQDNIVTLISELFDQLVQENADLTIRVYICGRAIDAGATFSLLFKDCYLLPFASVSFTKPYIAKFMTGNVTDSLLRSRINYQTVEADTQYFEIPNVLKIESKDWMSQALDLYHLWCKWNRTYF